jgi:hypothetical protein
MLARCARCQGTFTTDRFGRQFCPHCGSELILADPNAPAPPQAPPTPPGPPADTGWEAAPPPPPAGGEAPPPVSPPPPAGGGWAPPPSPPPPPQGDLPSPFAARGQRGFFGAFFETWKRVATGPQRFFAETRVDQVGPAILFGLLAAWVGGTLAALLGLATNMSTVAMLREMAGNMPPDQAEMIDKILPFFMGSGVVIQIVAIPVSVILGMFILSGLMHLVLLMFRGAGRGFGGTLTVVAYSYGIHLLDAVPGCGGIISGVWQIVILVIGLAAVHRTEIWKSLVAALSPLIVCCCCICGGAFTAGMLGAATKGAGGSTNL